MIPHAGQARGAVRDRFDASGQCGADTSGVGIDTPFAGHALNAVDAKGRVSVPASFRNTVAQRLRAGGALLDEKGGVIMIAPHPKGDRLRAYDQVGVSALMEELRQDVADLPAAERREALAELRRAEMGSMVQVPYDAAGRMVLPPVLREIAGVGELAYFVGVGDHFEIWAPDQAEAAFAKQPMMLTVLRSYLKAREA